MRIGKYAPWFRAGRGESEKEPLSYRAWKWLCQQALYDNWESDLFQRLDSIEWDLLILLDACRYDILANLAECAVINRAISPATHTTMFFEKARENRVFDDVTYISANPQSGDNLSGHVGRYIPLYETKWQPTLQTVPPEPVYEEVVNHIGNGTSVVAHTIQPHYPHICKIDDRWVPVPGGVHPSEISFSTGEKFTIQKALSRGSIGLERAKSSYRACLRHAWEAAVSLSADLIDRGFTVVVTSDHGELFGEWGFVEHPVGISVKSAVEVPWIVFQPHSDSDSLDVDVSDKLAALGYLKE